MNLEIKLLPFFKFKKKKFTQLTVILINDILIENNYYCWRITAYHQHNKQDSFPAVIHSIFPVLIEVDMNKIVVFILNPLLFRSVRASRRIQWLDRCLWSGQSVALVKPNVTFQEQDEGVAAGPGPKTSVTIFFSTFC